MKKLEDRCVFYINKRKDGTLIIHDHTYNDCIGCDGYKEDCPQYYTKEQLNRKNYK